MDDLAHELFRLVMTKAENGHSHVEQGTHPNDINNNTHTIFLGLGTGLSVLIVGNYWQ